MVDKARVLALYDRAINSVRDVANPLIHHSSTSDAQHYGAAMLERVKLFAGSVLDLGSSVANPLACFDEQTLRNLDYTGLDLNPRFVQLARERWQSFPNLKFAVYDISACSLGRNFDVIFVNETFAYFNSAEICAMIDYYAGRADKLFSASLLMPRERPASLLIEQTDVAPIVNHVLAKFRGAIINRAAYPDRLRIDILKAVN